MMKYVQMSEKHVEQVATIENMCFSLPWSLKSISGELTNPLSCWIVALENDTVVGYVGSQVVLGEADMMNLAVLPSFRQHGIGQRLVEALIEHLKAAGVHVLTLEVRASNTAAISLYTKLGFSQVGCRPRYYSKPIEDALILRKEWEA